MEVLIMSASAHRYTCDQLGACQSRPTPCTSCTPDPYLLNTAQPVSEGTASAQRIEREYGRQFRPMPTSVPAMQLQETEQQRLRRVLAIKPAHACTGGMCMGDAACPDHHCQGHPRNAVREDERDARLARWVWGVYAALAIGVVLALTF
jgi:hypothetical protein